MIKGFIGTSLVDFPGRIASVVFVYRCNFRCPYCYNLDLVLPERYETLETISGDWIINELKRREGFIKGLVITGGEPTLWGGELFSFLDRIKCETGLPTKIDTNGSLPEVLKKLLESRLVNFVAIDFKTSPEKYALVGGSFKQVEKSFSILKESSIESEVRITCYPPLIDKETLNEMLPYLKGFKTIALQKFVPGKTLNPEPVSPYSEEDLKSFAKFLKENLPDAQIVERF